MSLGIRLVHLFSPLYCTHLPTLQVFVLFTWDDAASFLLLVPSLLNDIYQGYRHDFRPVYYAAWTEIANDAQNHCVDICLCRFS